MDNLQGVLRVIDKAKENVEQTWNSNLIEKVNECFSYAEDISIWVSRIEALENNILVAKSLDECKNSLLMSVQGYYKEAIFSLRQFYEHILFAVYLSTSDLKYRLWKKGQYDMSWATITATDTGIFSSQFIRCYADDFIIDRSADLIEEAMVIYRDCSEFVHGNYKKIEHIQAGLPYDACLLEKYLEYFSRIEYIVAIAVFIRFRELLDIDQKFFLDLEPIILQHLGTLPEVQRLYSSEVEKNE